MFQIITFYKFIPLNGLAEKRHSLRSAMRKDSITGTIIIADEGFNSTVCGAPANIKSFVSALVDIFGCEFEYKSSFHAETPFRKIDVKIKPEIVTLKQDVNISFGKGTHVEPKDWNSLISDPEVLVLDTRNDYEVMNGTFPRAVNPKTRKFSELPGFVDKNLDSARHAKVAMYCTGGIRCEKFAPYLRSLGFEQVFQLQGGILNYLEHIPAEESLWQGECFVFDTRTTVNEKLKKGVGQDHSLGAISGEESK